MSACSSQSVAVLGSLTAHWREEGGREGGRGGREREREGGSKL